MRPWLAALLLALAWTWAARAQSSGIVSEQIPSSQADGLYNAANEESAPRAMNKLLGGNQVLKTWSLNAIASGAPTTCTWNILCTNKIGVIVDADYNSIGEVAGVASDLSCLADNAQRLTQFANRTFRQCKVKLISIGGGTTPAVTFYLSGVAQ